MTVEGQGQQKVSRSRRDRPTRIDTSRHERAAGAVSAAPGWTPRQRLATLIRKRSRSRTTAVASSDPTGHTAAGELESSDQTPVAPRRPGGQLGESGAEPADRPLLRCRMVGDSRGHLRVAPPPTSRSQRTASPTRSRARLASDNCDSHGPSRACWPTPSAPTPSVVQWWKLVLDH